MPKNTEERLLSSFGQVFEEALRVVGIKRVHVALSAGIDRSTIDSYLDEGGPVPSQPKREAIARAMLLPPRLFDVPVPVALKMLNRLRAREIQPQWDTGWGDTEIVVPSVSGADRAAKRRVVVKAAGKQKRRPAGD